MLETVLAASLEIRSSIVSATYVLMLVFVPLLLLRRLEGRLLRPLAICVLGRRIRVPYRGRDADAGALLLLLPKRLAAKAQSSLPVMAWLLRRYEPILRASIRHPGESRVGAALAVVAWHGRAFRPGRSFLPEFNEGSLTINMVLAPGTPLKESDALASMAERGPARRSRRDHRGATHRTRRERRARARGRDERDRGSSASWGPAHASEQLFFDIRERLEAVGGAQFTLSQPISHRIEHMISGQRSALSVKVFGENLRELRAVAERIKHAAEGVAGLVDLGVEQVVDVPELLVRIDAPSAAAYGFSAGEAATAVGTALWGAVATQIYEAGTTTEVVVRYPSQALDDLEAVRRLRVPTPGGALVPISALAEVRRDSGPNYVLRENIERRVVVTANVSGRDVRSAYEEIRRRVEAEI